MSLVSYNIPWSWNLFLDTIHKHIEDGKSAIVILIPIYSPLNSVPNRRQSTHEAACFSLTSLGHTFPAARPNPRVLQWSGVVLVGRGESSQPPLVLETTWTTSCITPALRDVPLRYAEIGLRMASCNCTCQGILSRSAAFYSESNAVVSVLYSVCLPPLLLTFMQAGAQIAWMVMMWRRTIYEPCAEAMTAESMV